MYTNNWKDAMICR